jgi:ABC-type bacteriocin/lantibiotic exporter with double-glycine peptidase domain
MRYQSVLQHSEEDCGAACIATVGKHEGRIFAISFVKKFTRTNALHKTQT